MGRKWTRRKLFIHVGAAGVWLAGRGSAASADTELQISSVSPRTLRITLFPVRKGAMVPVPSDGSLVQESWGRPLASIRGITRAQIVNAGELRVKIAPDPLSLTIESAQGDIVQQLKIDPASGVVAFRTGDAPLLALPDDLPVRSFCKRAKPGKCPHEGPKRRRNA